MVIKIIAAIILISLFAIGSIAAYETTENEVIYGAWINPEYGQNWYPRKIVYYPDGTWKRFRHYRDLATDWYGTYTLVEKWTDSDGNIWYKFIWEWEMWDGGKFYETTKISNSGSTMESIISEYDFPRGVVEDHQFYRIYSRMEE